MCVIVPTEPSSFVHSLKKFCLPQMLDMHRAASRQLKIERSLACIYNDVLKPVESMLHRRGSNVKVIVECNPPNMVVNTDVLRLKQVMLNLGRNSSKFVEKGFIYLSAAVVDGTVQLSVADTGMGIPVEKRGNLFEKFQESLDSLNQGTGIGLSLCKNLVELMGGEIYLDEAYDSDVEGYPGARFVVDLKVAPESNWDLPDNEDEVKENSSQQDLPESAVSFYTGGPSEEFTTHSSDSVMSSTATDSLNLPENLTCLFVDDDMVIRRLFCRALANACPTWKIGQAANGETALRLVKESQDVSSAYDIIFMDQYMASGAFVTFGLLVC